MFNAVNVDFRRRERIRGRVLCFTDSRHIEFINDTLTQSYPLWNNPVPFFDGWGVAFSVELDGYLSFDRGAQVRILELSPFVRGDYDPTRFALVEVADFQGVLSRKIDFLDGTAPNGESGFLAIVTLKVGSPNGEVTKKLVSYSPYPSKIDAQHAAETTILVGAPFTPYDYPGFGLG